MGGQRLRGKDFKRTSGRAYAKPFTTRPSAFFRKRFYCMKDDPIHRPSIVACIWDFDKTLIPGYMQEPLFRRFGIEAKTFWKEVNALPPLYEKRGTRVSPDTVYLNHLLTCVRLGPMKGLNNAQLRELGGELVFYPGLPQLFGELQDIVTSNPAYQRHDIRLEHYIISTGLKEMILGSAISEYVEGVFASEFIENPAPPGFLAQGEIEMSGGDVEISQIGFIVDNTIKTRFIFEINKGTNKNPAIDVNAKIDQKNRRVPIPQMIYVADGPSDVPVFSVVRERGGKTYAVYDPKSDKEFDQNDDLQQAGRIDSYGPADYRPDSPTARWLRRHVTKICDRIVRQREIVLDEQVGRPPQHVHENEKPVSPPPAPDPQTELLPAREN